MPTGLMEDIDEDVGKDEEGLDAPQEPEEYELQPEDRDPVVSYRQNRRAFLERQAEYKFGPSAAGKGGEETARRVEAQLKKENEVRRLESLRSTLTEDTPKNRVQELNERAQWLRDFVQRLRLNPGSVIQEEVNTVLEYVEEFKEKASEENQKKITALVDFLKTHSPGTEEGKNKFEQTALSFAGQYERLAEREQMAIDGVEDKAERKARTPFVPYQPQVTTPQPQNAPAQPSKWASFMGKATTVVSGWLSRAKVKAKKFVERVSK